MLELPGLARNDTASLQLRRRFVFDSFKQLNSIKNSRNRVTQFMIKHGQELVFAPIQGKQGLRVLRCLILHAAALGDVVQTNDGTRDLGLVVFQRHDVGDHRDFRAIRAFHHHFNITRCGGLAREYRGDWRLVMLQSGTVRVMQLIGTAVALAGIAKLGFTTPQCHGVAVKFLNHARGVDGVHRQRPPIKQGAKPGLALAQVLLGALVLGDITGRAKPFGDLTGLVQQRDRTRERPAHTAINAPDSML